MKREVTPTENAILDMLHQVQQNQEAEMEATARHALESYFEEDADISFKGILVADSLKLADRIVPKEQLPEKLTRRERRQREMATRFDRIRRQRIHNFSNGGYHDIIIGGIAHASRVRRWSQFRHTPVVLKTYPEPVDVSNTAEARISFGWCFELNCGPKPPGSLAWLDIYKVTSDEMSDKKIYEKIYDVSVNEHEGEKHVTLRSPEINNYLAAAKKMFHREHGNNARFNEYGVELPDEFYYQPIGLIEQGMAELDSMNWQPAKLPYPLSECSVC